MEDNFERIESSTPKKIIVKEVNEKENQLYYELLSEMVYTAPFHRYIINVLKNFIKTHQEQSSIPIFEKSKFTTENIFEYFENEIKQKNKNFKINNSQSSSISDNNSSIKSNSKDKTNKSIYEYTNKKKKLKFMDLMDSINFYGAEYEIHIQCLIAQILKCYETKENSFSINFNIEYKFNKKDINDVEFDFIINNVEPNLFKSFIGYLKDNIIYFNINNTSYSIIQKKEKSIEDIINSLSIDRNIDILGEIGLSGWKDENKIEQFSKYTQILKLIKSKDFEKNSKNKTEPSFYEKTGLNDNNTKILFFITDSKFKELLKFIETSKLINEMKKVSKEINSILLYMGIGLNEKVILSNYLSEKSDDDGKTNIIKLNIKKTDYEIEKSERFKKACYVLNSFLNSIKHLKFNIDKDLYLTSFTKRINSRKMQIKFELNQLDNYKIDKAIKPSNIYILHFSFNSGEKNKNNLERIAGKNNYLNFIYGNKKTNEMQLNKIKDLNKINNIFIVILENVEITDFQEILEQINLKYYDIFLPNDCENNYNNLMEDSIKEENNYYYKSLNNEEDLQKIKIIKKGAEDLLQKLNNFFEKKKIYDILVKVYIQLTTSKVRIFDDKEEINNFIEKIYEILFFMENLKVPESNFSKNDENKLTSLLSFINNLKSDYSKNKGEGEIKKILDTIGEATDDHELKLDNIKTNFVNICNKYFNKFIIKLSYDYFVNKFVPIYSNKIWNLIIKKEFYKK